jgi:hypothetical protein
MENPLLHGLARSHADVIQPGDGTQQINGLPCPRGNLCHLDGCAYRSLNDNRMAKHYNVDHQWKVPKKGRMPWHHAYF